MDINTLDIITSLGEYGIGGLGIAAISWVLVRVTSQWLSHIEKRDTAAAEREKERNRAFNSLENTLITVTEVNREMVKEIRSQGASLDALGKSVDAKLQSLVERNGKDIKEAAARVDTTLHSVVGKLEEVITTIRAHDVTAEKRKTAIITAITAAIKELNPVTASEN